MILYGFFHGDVHAGNLMMLDDGALGFLDFGIIGRFDTKTRRQIAEYIVAFALGRLSHARPRAHVDGRRLAGRRPRRAWRAISRRPTRPSSPPASATSTTAIVLPDILRASVKHRMRLPREFVLVTKQMLYFDRYAKLLAPKLNIFSDPRLVAAISEDVMRATYVADCARLRQNARIVTKAARRGSMCALLR